MQGDRTWGLASRWVRNCCSPMSNRDRTPGAATTKERSRNVNTCRMVSICRHVSSHTAPTWVPHDSPS